MRADTLPEALPPRATIASLAPSRVYPSSDPVTTIDNPSKVRSMLATARPHALKALFQSVGLFGDVAAVFIKATLLWRSAAQSHLPDAVISVSGELLAHFSDADGSETFLDLLHAIRRLAVAEQRQKARHYARAVTVEAA